MFEIGDKIRVNDNFDGFFTSGDIYEVTNIYDSIIEGRKLNDVSEGAVTFCVTNYIADEVFEKVAEPPIEEEAEEIDMDALRNKIVKLDDAIVKIYDGLDNAYNALLRTLERFDNGVDALWKDMHDAFVNASKCYDTAYKSADNIVDLYQDVFEMINCHEENGGDTDV